MSDHDVSSKQHGFLSRFLTFFRDLRMLLKRGIKSPKPMARTDVPIGGGSPSDEDGWTEEKNARRCELIYKETRGEITEEEAAELADLTRQVDEFIAPLIDRDLEEARRIHERVLQNKQP